MTLAELIISTVFKVDEKSKSNAEATISKLGSYAKKALGAIGIGFSIAGLSELAETAAEADALKSQFKQVFGDMESDAQKRLDAISQNTGVSVNRMKGSFTQIAAFAKTTGLEQADSLEIADRAMKAVADSAAFYDRSIEDVTESLRSFLKGNYENDAALGLSATEATRNIAANKLYGRSFRDLSEAEKQFTLLQMVEDANDAAGAFGQAARESGQWENQVGNLKQAFTDLKAALGGTFLKPAVAIVKTLAGVVQKAANAIKSLTDENGLLTKESERYQALVKKLQPSVERLTKAMRTGFDKAVDVFKKVVDKLGGAQNAFRLLKMVAVAFFAIMAFDKVTSGAKGLIKVLGGLGKALGLGKLLLLVAVVTILFLLFEDFFNFMIGNDSVIGEVFEKAGIDADTARQTIVNAWNNAKELVLGIWDALKQAGEQLGQTLGQFWDQHGQTIMEFLSGVMAGVGTVIAIIIGLIGPAINFITGMVGALFSFITGDMDGFYEYISMIGQSIIDAFLAIWNALPEPVREKITEVYENIKQGIQDAIDFLKGLPEQALQWGRDFIDGFKKGVEEKIEAVKEAVGGIADKIKGVLHFSRPDEGPLRDYETWMPDFMSGLAKGINDNAPAVLDAVGKLTEGMSAIADKTVPTARTAFSAVKNYSRSVVQNNTFSNTYGGSMDMQKTASKAMKRSTGDATAALANALRYS